MARTELGRKLTKQHKADQVTLGATAAALTLANAKRLDINNLDGTRAGWEVRQVLIIEALRRESALLARRYVEAFRAAEGMAPAKFVPPKLPPAIDAVSWVVPTLKARLRDGAS